jgi:repressor LexA
VGSTATFPGDEGTVKTYTRVGDEVVLLPANPALAPMHFRPDEVAIYGRVVTVMRKL